MNRKAKWWVVVFRPPSVFLRHLLTPLYSVSFGLIDKLCRALLFDVPTGIHSTVPTQIRIPILTFRLHALDGANPEIAIALRSWKSQRTRSGLFHQSSRSTRYQLS